MAHYAFLDENNVVVEVIVGKHESEDGIDWETHYGQLKGLTCKRTSYRTSGGVHLDGEVPFRKNYAGLGYLYDPTRDAFISPKPYDSWLLDEESCTWKAPTDYPNDGKLYIWDEETTSWIIPQPITYVTVQIEST